ncbi:hypothetical protein BU16DRAFT_558210 [Lophium mytilinum]|uniref:Uncharacterized protein n=1 Tax=Lophium mytilinum TaxID=390894 RepID=A0A6A6R1M0_9PEZI|nr:hypothetical protein BU16DRAFT_558210 [Lophium mytilinum]
MAHRLDPPKWNVTHFDNKFPEASSQHIPKNIEKKDTATSPVPSRTEVLTTENFSSPSGQGHEVETGHSHASQLLRLHAAIRELRGFKKGRREFLKKFGEDEQVSKDTKALAAKILHIDCTLGFAGATLTHEMIQDLLAETTSLVAIEKQVMVVLERAMNERDVDESREMEAVSARPALGTKWKAEEERLQQNRLPPSQPETYEVCFQCLMDTLQELREDANRRRLLLEVFDFAAQYRAQAVISKSNMNMLIRRVKLSGEGMAVSQLNRLLADALELTSTKPADSLAE